MFVHRDFLTTNGSRLQAHGPVGERLGAIHYDPGFLRPYLDNNDNLAVTVNTGRWTRADSTGGERREIKEHRLVRDMVNSGMMPPPPVTNATALRKEEWTYLDTVVLRAARYRLRAWADLSAANSFGGFNAMGKMVLEHETMSDAGDAIVSMDGLTDGRRDFPKFQLEGLPLPITHSDFSMSSRVLAISRISGTPLDTNLGEMAGRRVAESIEKTTIGNNTGVVYGGNSTQVGGYGRTSKVYGYTNFTSRLTYTHLHAPSGASWVASQTLNDVLAMRDQLKANKFFGPYMLYTSNDWDQYLDNDYILTGGNVATQTLRERLKAIDDIQDVRRLDMLFSVAPDTNAASTSYRGPGGEGVTTTSTSPFTLLMIQMTPDVCQAVNGMDLTTVQWEGKGGMELNFKCMAIQVPRLRADIYGSCGICHGTTA